MIPPCIEEIDKCGDLILDGIRGHSQTISLFLSPGNPWTVWTVTGSDVEGTDNPVDLILYGDKGHSQPVIIGGAENFSFSKDQVDVFDVSDLI